MNHPSQVLQLHVDVVLYWSLVQFYSKGDYWKRFCTIVSSSPNKPLSIRIINYAVTKWARYQKIEYMYGNRRVNLYPEYMAELKATGKKRFDPFCRKGDKLRQQVAPKFLFCPNNSTVAVETNIGQLNFFRFALLRGVDEMVKKSIPIIKASLKEEKKRTTSTSAVQKKVFPSHNSSHAIDFAFNRPCHCFSDNLSSDDGGKK